ncbi:MAG: primosomal replication protein N [Methylophilales bacterium]|nr:primosomal replication protein N [Methylophilales bacterium]
MSNRLTLSGEVTSLDTLRYTPAGIPVVTFTLRHASVQDEAGMKRQADCEVPVMAMAEMANKAKTLQVGDSIKVLGFLTKKSLKNDRLVLHINELEI